MQPATAPQFSEAQRFERLRAQDGKPLIPPPSMHALLGQGGLDPAKARQALEQWQAAAHELAAVPSYPAEERLFWCFFLLSALRAKQGDRKGAIALAQQTIVLVRDPRHQQLVLGGLARHAALTGDTQVAEQSAAQLYSASEDLLIDTNYRLTTAHLATLRGDDTTVLAALGYNTSDIPISDAYDGLCAAMRANAHERQGRADVAKQQLTAMASSTQGLASLRQIVQANHELGLLQQTLPALEQHAQQLHGNVVQTRSGISLGGIFVLPILGIVVFGGGGAAVSTLPAQVQAIATTVATVGFIAISFAVAARLVLRGPRQRKRLARSGLDGVAQLIEAQATGTRVNHQPMFRLRMLIELPDRPPYIAVHHEIMAADRAHQLPPGTRLRVKVDRGDPRIMAILWG